MNKILIIEDEPGVINLLKRGLEEDGYAISVAPDGITGYKMAVDHFFDLIISDIMLPGMNGLEVCRKLKEEKVASPILLLTALGSTENVVTGLDSGADDYLTKPFNFNELRARIRTALRRTNSLSLEKENILKIDDLVVDSDKKTVTRNGTQIQLTSTEFRLLEYLMKNKNRVVSRPDLLENVWNVDFNMNTNVVDVYINYLRKKIDKDFPVKLIHTSVGMGYTIKEQ